MHRHGDRHRSADAAAGRIDDVLNVSGHRIGTAEVEGALASHPAVSEAAVVPVSHDIKGQGIYAFVSLMAVRFLVIRFSSRPLQSLSSCLCCLASLMTFVMKHKNGNAVLDA